MSPIQKVAVFGAAGNFGGPITSALLEAGYTVTVVTRRDSRAEFPPAVSSVVRTSGYADLAELHSALRGQDAAICALAPGALPFQEGIVVAAEAAGLRRLVVSDFGWGPDHRRHLPDFADIGDARSVPVHRARALARSNPAFSWTAVAIGNPIEWALKKFPTMGFDISTNTAIIYDTGTETFTGTTTQGIAQAVIGVLRNPDETANRVVRVRSVQTCQQELLAAFRDATPGREWTVRHETVASLIERGRAKREEGLPWHLDLAVAQLYEEGQARSVLVSRQDSDNDLVGVRDETVAEVVAKVLA
ncbi:hypothetical protein PpBr36_01017 [Pyricularia pennisetigena]|uniref:hypothetical protein n=1 Tax=Pyricularia pennisetigena TaxID=1578925 RepID=UPI001154358E|nr:hypothetical protein PpBr36_01017 [Pyricularia pennisetigena]TLS27771.1 hypothetical protein PpBr36_01017 [Pyricularia pennisetigena]